MKFTRKSNPRRKPLDLVRRAKLLRVTPAHLSMVLAGKRQSVSLVRRLEKLLQAESRKQTPSTKQPQN